MTSVRIVDNIYWVGTDDRRDIMFEGLWPIPQGVTYNSYVLKGREKIALVDTVDRFYSTKLISNISEVVEPSKIDYVILNHLEPDHSGSLEDILKAASNAHVVGSPMAISIAKAYYSIKSDYIEVRDGDMLSLGDMTLKFISAPWLHWPETIFTYEEQNQVLFSGDAFGTFGAADGRIFDDDVDIGAYEGEMKRYYADIVSHYASFVIKAGEKIRNLPIRILCTTHGPTYRRNPSYPISRYLDWSSNRDENKVVIAYGSMYEHMREAAEYLREALGGRGVAVKSFDLTAVHPGYVLPELIDAKAVLIGAPTYEGEIFPPVSNMIEYMKIKHIRPKPVAIFANYSWGSRITEALKMRLSEIGMKVIEPSLLVRGRMSEEDKQKADLMIENLTKELS